MLRSFAKYIYAIIAGAAVTFCTTARAEAQAVPLDTAAAFGVLAGSTVTNTGTSVINGNVGVSPGGAIIGFPPGIVNGTIHAADAVAGQAQSDLTTAYNNLAGRTPTANLTGQDLGGLMLTAGVYTFNTSAQLTGTLTLNGQGNPNSLFIFNIASTLTTASASSIQLTNGAQGGNVFFRVGSSATLGSGTSFVGDIIALTSITLDTAATINCGAALARNGAVTLDTNTIGICALLQATAASLLPPGATANQAAVANAIDAFIAGGGTLPAGFQDLLSFLTPAELAAAFAQLSGEAGTGMASAGIQAMDSFLSLVLNPFDDDDRSGNRVVAVKRPGYFKAPIGVAPDPRSWDIWAAAYGGLGKANGDLAAGTHDLSARSFGFATGLDYHITPDTMVGFALGGGGTNFGLSDGLGGGRSDMFQAAIYSRTHFDAAYIASALAYAWHGVSTDRYVTVAGTDHLTADFSAYNVAARIEGGYRFPVSNVLGFPWLGWFTPYGALQVQTFHTPSYNETAESGSSLFALAYSAETITTTRTELGAKVGQSLELDNGAVLALRSRVAWAHDMGSNPSVVAAFQSLPGSSFTVNGASLKSDSALLLAGAELRFRNGLSIGGWFDSELAPGYQIYSGTARLRYAF